MKRLDELFVYTTDDGPAKEPTRNELLILLNAYHTFQSIINAKDSPK